MTGQVTQDQTLGEGGVLGNEAQQSNMMIALGGVVSDSQGMLNTARENLDNAQRALRGGHIKQESKTNIANTNKASGLQPLPTNDHDQQGEVGGAKAEDLQVGNSDIDADHWQKKTGTGAGENKVKGEGGKSDIGATR